MDSQAVITAIDDRTPSVRIITLVPEKPFPYKAGQYIQVMADGYEQRSFSIANRPEATGAITLHIRNVGSGLSAYLAQIPLGKTLGISGPYGSMDIEPARNRPVLMVAGGTGIAPLLAMVQEIMRHGITEDGITLVYGARTQDDIYCHRELDALLSTGEVSLIKAIGDETPDKILAKSDSDLSNHSIYLSGPAAMVTSVQAVLKTRNANPELIFTDDWIRKP